MTGRGQEPAEPRYEGSAAQLRSSSARRRQRASRRRIRRVHLRLSEQEFAAIAQAAKSLGRTPAGFAAEAALAAARDEALPRPDSTRDVVLELMAARAQLRRYGSNVNQVARVLNAGGDPPEWLQAAITIANRVVESIDRAVAGVVPKAH